MAKRLFMRVEENNEAHFEQVVEHMADRFNVAAFTVVPGQHIQAKYIVLWPGYKTLMWGHSMDDPEIYEEVFMTMENV